jgi:cephalosporin hydroxylase
MMTEVERIVTMMFHGMFYGSSHTWNKGYTKWLGHVIYQNPMDLMMFQEVIWNTMPDVIVETGTYYGGSALYFATVLEHLNKKARVITIDTNQECTPTAKHPQITFIEGNSVSPAVVKQVKGMIKRSDKVMVVLDSEHHEKHVASELELYAPLVGYDMYLVVCDTNLGGNPIELVDVPKSYKGPMGALQKFLKTHPEFVHNDWCERFYLTFNPGAWLRRMK